MIDVHCHLSYEDFDEDRDTVIQKAQKQMKAVIDSGPSPADAKKSLEMHKKYPNFVYSTLGLHPTEVIKLSEKQIEAYMEFIKANKEKIHGIGEVGIDYFEIKGMDDIRKTKDIFIRFVELARELKLPLIVHARDAFDDAVKILEQANARQVLMHMFGARELLKRVIENGWFISLNTIVLRSKKHKKIARDFPLENLLTETDSPWLNPQGGRNTPLNIKVVLEKISEIKKLPFDEVDKITTQNAIKFFNLSI